MEAAAILIISILGLTLLVVAVVSVASNLNKQNNNLTKTIITKRQKTKKQI